MGYFRPLPLAALGAARGTPVIPADETPSSSSFLLFLLSPLVASLSELNAGKMRAVARNGGHGFELRNLQFQVGRRDWKSETRDSKFEIGNPKSDIPNSKLETEGSPPAKDVNFLWPEATSRLIPAINCFEWRFCLFLFEGRTISSLCSAIVIHLTLCVLLFVYICIIETPTLYCGSTPGEEGGKRMCIVINISLVCSLACISLISLENFSWSEKPGTARPTGRQRSKRRRNNRGEIS